MDSVYVEDIDVNGIVENIRKEHGSLVYPIRNYEDYCKYFKTEKPVIYKSKRSNEEWTSFFIPVDWGYLRGLLNGGLRDALTDVVMGGWPYAYHIMIPVSSIPDYNRGRNGVPNFSREIRDYPELYDKVFDRFDVQKLNIQVSSKDPTKLTYPTLLEHIKQVDLRKDISPLKLIKMLCHKLEIEFTDEMLKETDMLIASLSGNLDLSTIYSHEIMSQPEAFYRTYSLNISSCMQDCPREFFDIYANNTDKVNIIRIRKHGEVMGRALLWTTDDGSKLVDRIYPSDEGKHITYLKQWAEKNGIDSLKRQSTSALVESGQTYQVTLNIKGCRAFPYLDTFSTIERDYDGETVVLENGRGGDNFRRTDGAAYIKGFGWPECSDCDNPLGFHEVNDGECRCENCRDDDDYE